MSLEPADLEARFHALLAAWGPALSRLCRGHEADPVRREELRQDVMLALWRALPSFRGDASWRTFVFRVAHNTALNHARHEGRDRSEPGLPASLVDERTDPGVRIDRNRRREDLLEAIRGLRAVDRELVMLHLEGMTNTEVAEVVGLSASNVGTRLGRIRRRLEQQLEGRHDR